MRPALSRGAGRPPGLAGVAEQAKRSRLQQIIERAGAKRRNEQLLARIDDAFGEAGIVTFPRLTDPKNKPDERIYLFDRDHQMHGLVVNRQAFRNQAALRDFILDNIHEFDELRGLAGITPEARLVVAGSWTCWPPGPGAVNLSGLS